jgi:hypothetical protein
MSKSPTSRARVYEVLNSERAHQDKLWGPVPSRGEHTVAEWLVYIHDYTQEAMHQCSRGADPAASEAALRTVRKITAMGVACMEQCGALRRETDPPKDQPVTARTLEAVVTKLLDRSWLNRTLARIRGR